MAVITTTYIVNATADGELPAGTVALINPDGSPWAPPLGSPTSSVRGGVLQQADSGALTDSSGGTSGGGTIGAIALASAAATGADTSTLPTLTSVNTSLTALRNAIATEAAKYNAIRNALRAAGLMA